MGPKTRSSRRSGREAHAQASDRMHEIVGGDIYIAVPFNVREPSQQLPISLFQLDLRHALAKADMRAVSESDMLVRI